MAALGSPHYCFSFTISHGCSSSLTSDLRFQSNFENTLVLNLLREDFATFLVLPGLMD